MKHEKLSEALEHIDSKHIMEAAGQRRKRLPWIGAVAAVLALCVLAGVAFYPKTQPQPILQDPTDHTLATTDMQPEPHPQWQPAQPVELLSNRYAVATPNYPTMIRNPSLGGQGVSYQQWRDDQKALHDQPDGYADNLQETWAQLLPKLLDSQEGENIVCSPVNVYMALAMLAECTGGESRQQLLELMNAANINALRTQAKQVWRAHYNDDGLSKSVLASSLWLQKDYGFDPNTVQLLADHYYASVFQGDLGSAEMNTALRSWLNEQTEGLLTDQVQDVKMDPQTSLALATTINYQVQWLNEFSEKANVQAIFHGAKGDTAETFMRTTLEYGPYYWSDRFGATALPLEDGSLMWLILPDEGVAPEAIVGEAVAFLEERTEDYPNQKMIQVHLSVPKFDVVSDKDLSDSLKALGVQDIFVSGKADFSAILPKDDGGYINQVKHAARVLIDEKGVTAAAFTVIMRYGAFEPPTDEIDFILDRPFLFVVESRDGLPLFAGIVNEP